MEYFLSFALLVLNLIDYERDLGYVVFTLFSVAIFVMLFAVVFRKTGNFLVTCVALMCHTWQISWINIFGDPTSNFQLPWFYILGLLIVLYALFNVGTRAVKSYSAVFLALFFAFIIIFNYPLFISESLTEGLKEYVMIGFFAVVLFCVYLYHDEVSREMHEYLKSAFIWAAFTTSVLLIFQYSMYSEFGVALFKLSISKYFNSYQLSCRLLMEDHSCATIMLGCAVFYIAERIKRKTWIIYVPALAAVLIALAMTSRRTSTLILAGVAMLYVYFHYKGLGKKLLFLIIFGIGLVAMIYYLLIVRPVESFSQAISDNGRFENYLSALNLIIENPLGVGYDGYHLASLMPNYVVPHNTILRWFCIGGFLFPIPLIGLIAYVFRTAAKKKMPCEYWAILYTAVAANFIPDILNARFFIIPCAIVFLIDTRERVPVMASDNAPPSETEKTEETEKLPEQDAEAATE